MGLRLEGAANIRPLPDDDDPGVNGKKQRFCLATRCSLGDINRRWYRVSNVPACCGGESSANDRDGAGTLKCDVISSLELFLFRSLVDTLFLV